MSGEFFILLLVGLYIGWIAVAAIRSNRREAANGANGDVAQNRASE